MLLPPFLQYAVPANLQEIKLNINLPERVLILSISANPQEKKIHHEKGAEKTDTETETETEMEQKEY